MKKQKNVLSITAVVISLILIILISASLIKTEIIDEKNVSGNGAKDVKMSPQEIRYGAQPDAGETDDPLTNSSINYSGDVYYFDSINGDDSKDGLSPANAWKTLMKLHSKTDQDYLKGNPSAPNGSAFLFKRGQTFNGLIRISPRLIWPAFAQNYTFGAYGGPSQPRPILHYENQGYNSLISSGEGNSFNFRNLILEGNESSGIGGVALSGADNVSFINMVIQNFTGYGGAVLGDGSDNVLIQNSVIMNDGEGGYYGSGVGLRIINSSFINNGVYFLAHNIYLRGSMINAVIEGNLFTGSLGGGITIHNDGVINRGTRISGNEFFGNLAGIDISGSGESSNFTNVTIENNKIHDNNYGLLLKSLVDSNIRNNLIYNNKDLGINIDPGSGANSSSKNVLFYNNLLFTNGSSSLASFFDGNASNISFVNNIFDHSKNNNPIIHYYGGAEKSISEYSFDYNLYNTFNGSNSAVFWLVNNNTHYSLSQAAITLGNEIHGMVGNPLFVNPESGDFHLLDGSPAIDSGILVPVYNDFEGDNRPQGNGYDIGAYESDFSDTSKPKSNPECSDGIDNDGDGLVDWQYDLSCINATDNSEKGISGQLEEGWTNFEPSNDTRIIYVSSSEGNDGNDGLSPTTPVKTLNFAYSLLRDGYPDWMLLKRGDTWSSDPNVADSLRIWLSGSGRSASEPALIGSYGTSIERPLLNDITIHSGYGGTVNNFVIVGLHLERTSEFLGANGGIDWLAASNNLLIEDSLIRGFKDNIAIQGDGGSSTTDPVNNFKLRRTISADSYSSTGGHSQGLYMYNVRGALIEDDVFDHDGWNPNISGAEATIYNHNIYLGKSVYDVTVRNVISARASSHGLQLRRNGVIKDNLFLEDPIGLLAGIGYDLQWPDNVASVDVLDNVFLGGADIDGAPRGFGITTENVNGAKIQNNIIAHQIKGTDPHAIFFGFGYDNLDVENNIVYDWSQPLGSFTTGNGPNNKVLNNKFDAKSGALITHNVIPNPPWAYSGNQYFSGSPQSEWFDVQGTRYSPDTWQSFSGETNAIFTPVNFPDPNRTIDTYMAKLGYSQQQQTPESFLEEARQQSKYNWRQEYTAGVVNEYIREGFGMNKTTVILPVCGNNIRESGEECDDGNKNNQDSCSNQCKIETSCGNKKIESEEQCDDGNKINRDGCSSICEKEILIGANLGGLSSYSGTIYFNNIIHQSQIYMPNSTIANIILGDNGWPLAENIPYEGGTISYLMMNVPYWRSHGPWPPATTTKAERYPLGQYTLSFEGDGDMMVYGRIPTQFFYGQGTYYFNITNSDNGGLWVRVSRSNKNNPVKNIKILFPGYNTDESKNKYGPFYTPFIEELKNFDTIRTMKLLSTNNQPCSNGVSPSNTTCEVRWENRALPEDNQGAGKGIALEYIINMSNYAGVNLWLNIPPAATDDYIKNMSRLVHENLNKNLKLYLEYGNEMWNTATNYKDGWQYSIKKGQELGIADTQYAYEPWYAKRSGEIFCMFREAGFDNDRLVTVIAGHTVNPYYGRRILNFLNTTQEPYCNTDSNKNNDVILDAYSASAYIHVNPRMTTVEDSYNSLDEVYGLAKKDIADYYNYHIENKKLADNYGLRYVGYETGPAFLPIGLSYTLPEHYRFENITFEALRSEGIKDVYKEAYNSWTKAGGDLYNIFGLYGNLDFRDSFGHLEYVGQKPYENDADGLRPYRYEAILEIINDTQNQQQPKIKKIEGNTSNMHYKGFLKLLIDESENLEGDYTGIKNVKFEDGDKKLIEFQHDFDKKILDLREINITKDVNKGKNYLFVKGLNLSDKKTIYLQINNSNSKNKVCVLDEDVDNITTLTNNCIIMSCPGTLGIISCVNNGTYYIISNLTHSGVIEVEDNSTNTTTPSNPSGGSGGGGSGGGGGGSTSSTKKNMSNTTNTGTGTTNNENNLNSGQEEVVNNEGIQKGEEKPIINSYNKTIIVTLGALAIILLITIIIIIRKRQIINNNNETKK